MHKSSVKQQQSSLVKVKHVFSALVEFDVSYTRLNPNGGGLSLVSAAGKRQAGLKPDEPGGRRGHQTVWSDAFPSTFRQAASQTLPASVSVALWSAA